MKVVTSALALICLCGCKKDTDSFIDPATVEYRMSSIQEFPAFLGSYETHNYTYTNGRLLNKWKIKKDENYYWIESNEYLDISYNRIGKIIETNDNISFTNKNINSYSSNITWKYTDGRLTEMETINSDRTPMGKWIFTYTKDNLTKVNKFGYRDKRYTPTSYDEITWENGNVAAIKIYDSLNKLLTHLTFTYYTDKENKQLQLLPQLDMLFYVRSPYWAVDMFALMTSKNLIKTATKKGGCERTKSFKYELNEKGFIASMKDEKYGTPYLNFDYERYVNEKSKRNPGVLGEQLVPELRQ